MSSGKQLYALFSVQNKSIIKTHKISSKINLNELITKRNIMSFLP